VAVHGSVYLKSTKRRRFQLSNSFCKYCIFIPHDTPHSTNFLNPTAVNVSQSITLFCLIPKPSSYVFSLTFPITQILHHLLPYPQLFLSTFSDSLIRAPLNFPSCCRNFIWVIFFQFATMMHAKTDSDVTSMDTSSSPKRAVYYVQSPSRDSHDGDKSSTMHATPACNSPVDSPSHHSFGHHSRASSSSRVSGSFNIATWGRKGNRKRAGEKGWPECKVIEEEEGYGGERKGLSRRTQIFVGVVGFALIFCVFCLIIAGVARHFTVRVSVKVQPGSDMEYRCFFLYVQEYCHLL